MDGDWKRNRVYVNCRSRPYYDRRCKNKMSLSNLTNIDSLPDELVYQILLELRAQEIYESALFVCRKWYHMIRTHDFIHTHLRYSTSGLLIQYSCLSETNGPTFLTLRGGKIETCKFPDNFSWNTCNGLLLGRKYLPGGSDILSIVNPATKQHIALPVFPGHLGGRLVCSGIGYAPASLEYKVVLSYKPGPDPKCGCAIFTVGVDSSWRYVDTQHISHTASRILYSVPLITEGFAYWTISKGTSLLSLNLKSEIITEIHIPQVYYEYGERTMYYLSTCSSLTLLVTSSGFSWDVWELKKPETGEWKKLPNIDLKAQKRRVQQLPYRNDPPSNLYLYLRPVGWLNYGEVLVLAASRHAKVCLLYNVVTQETHFLELDGYTYVSPFSFLSYRNSLVLLDRCP